MMAMLLTAVAVGWMVSQFKVEWLLAIVLGAIAMGFVFYDYRVGAACLTVMLPLSWSPLLPQASGFNVINFLVFASMGSLLLRRAFGRERMVGLPRIMIWCYFLPLALAAFLAWPNLPIGQSNFPARLAGLVSDYQPLEFYKTKLVKPLFFILYAVLLANSVRDSKKPEWFLVPLGLSAVLTASTIVGRVLGGFDVNDRNNFLAGLGLQVNEYGALLSLAIGPLLFIAGGKGPRTARVLAGFALAVVAAGVGMTASRAGALASLTTTAIWLIKRRKLSDAVIVLVLVTVMAVLLPSQVMERLSMGFDDLSATRSDNSNDPLTQGRVHIWAMLAPEFLESPVWGNGLSSIGWNSAITSGRLWAVGHPHNFYLSLLLDLGVVGAAAMLYLLYRFGRSMRRLSAEESFSPLMRDYFSGAFASYLGMGVLSVTEGYYTAHPEQTYLWFSLGFTFAYWQLAQRPRALLARKPFGFGVKPPEVLHSRFHTDR